MPTASSRLVPLAIAAVLFGTSCGTSSSPADAGATGTLDIGMTFRPTGFALAVDCLTALVTTVRFRVFDPSVGNLLRAEVVRPCVPNERYRITLQVGPYQLRVQGLNGQQTICYESSVLHTVEGGRTAQLSLVAEQQPTGLQGGCQYPGSPP